MNIDAQDFQRGAVRPLTCLREGWQLIKDDYWLFLGIAFVGTLIGSMAQLFLMGPMMCGILYCLLRRERDQFVSFGMLFKGFDYFVPSLIAMLFMAIPGFILGMIGAVLYIVGIFSAIAMFPPQQGAAPDPELFWMIFGIAGAITIGMIAVGNFLNAFFLFVFPLIVDRKMSGFEAVKLSMRAALGNLFGVLGLTTLTFLITIAGLLLCYVGALLVMPLTYAMMIVAYRQVFPEGTRGIDVAMVVEPDAERAPPILEMIETGFQEAPPTAVTPSEPAGPGTT